MSTMRFWLIRQYEGSAQTAIRGQYGDTGDNPLLYEIYKFNGSWRCFRWVYLVTDPHAHAFEGVGVFTDCFDAMRAAEDDAVARYEIEAENEHGT